MSYTILDPQPAARAAELEDDAVGPGLYAGEIAVQLAGGDLAAVSVTAERLANGGGVALTARARAIEADGSTRLCAQDKPIETAAAHKADVTAVTRDGVDVLSREMLLLVLGEPETLVERTNPDDQTSFEAPLIGISEEAKLNASIAHAIEVAEACAAASDPAALLGAGG
jgi:hypothetical protein